ncbi:MAG: hypothetical protein QY326_04200 [Bdellovibrionota bacterium]|nr:MAG: hypothetical protein QY326_04200 [Bdellovibrionota bacterium]
MKKRPSQAPHALGCSENASYKPGLLCHAQESPLMLDETGALAKELERILKLPSPEKEQALLKFLLDCAKPNGAGKE